MWKVKKGTIEHQEKEFIQNVFEFNDIIVWVLLLIERMSQYYGCLMMLMSGILSIGHAIILFVVDR